MLQDKQGLLNVTIVRAQESSQVLDEEHLTFLADPGIADGQDTQPTIIHNAAFQTDDLDAYDSDCDDISSAKAVIMANLLSYGSDVLFEVPQHDTYQNDNMLNQSVQETQYFEQSLIDYVSDNKITSDSNIISYEQYLQQTQNIDLENKRVNESTAKLERYKERVKTFKQRLNVDLSNLFVDKKYFDIQKKENFLDNDRLLEHIICHEIMNIVMHANSVPVNVLPANNKCLVHDNLEIQRLEQENDYVFELLLSQDIVHICVNSLATRTDCHEMQNTFINEYNENLKLKAALTKKEHMVEKKFFDEVVLRCSRLENHTVNLELKLQHQKETKLDTKDVSIANLKKHIKSLKGKNVIEKDATTNMAKVIAPEMFKLDLEPLSPKVLKNRHAHIDYIKHTQENADILWELFEYARALKTLDSDLDSAYSHKTQDSNKPVLPSIGMKNSTSASRSQPSGNTKKNRISQTTSSNVKNKVEYHPRSVKSSSNKTNRVGEPVCTANVKHTLLNANFKLICVKCNQCMFDANHDMCFLEFVNDVNVHSKSKSAKRRTFTIVGNSCPLTRFTSTKVEPLMETTLKLVTTPNSEIKIYHRKTKVAKSVVQIVLWYLDSRCSKHMTGNRSQLINFVHKFMGTIRFGNDQIAKIMGYGDYQMGNVTISRVYYMEGLGHNLFSVGQFCDSDLEVAFRKHTCYICDLEGVDLLKGSRGSNLYTLSLEDMTSSSHICLLSKASKTKSWLWHR
ncbi:hypothetical protein Tco_0767566, partial [Tanacetum coccineum]